MGGWLTMKQKIKAFAFDGDGVLYKGKRIIKQTEEIVKMLQKKGFSVYLASNTSSHTSQHLNKLLMGLIDKEHVITAADLMLEYIEEYYKYVWPITTKAIMDEIIKRGLKIDGKKAEAVCIGFSKRYSFKRFSIGLRLLFNENVDLISANIDRYYIRHDGICIGNGFITKAFESTLNRKAIYFGKPNPEMLFRIAKKEGIKTSEIALIGDMMETDVKAAKNAGCLSIYVNNNVPQLEIVKPDIETDIKNLKNVIETLIEV